MAEFPHIDIIDPHQIDEFAKHYLHKKPVLVKGYCKNSRAVEIWDEDYFLNDIKDSTIKVRESFKDYQSAGGKYKQAYMQFKDYIQWLINNQQANDNDFNETKLFYIHNLHLEKVQESLLDDLDFIPEILVGQWHLTNWKKDLFMFYGNKNSITPLHYDALGTHNTFLQIKGHKKFTLIPAEQVKYCYMRSDNITLSDVNPQQPDYERFPLFSNATPYQANLEGGDLLYMPPYTLHHVQGMDLNISVNIDWHTKKSVSYALYSGKVKGLKCYYWNAVFFLGVCLGIPNRLLLPFYRSHYT